MQSNTSNIYTEEFIKIVKDYKDEIEINKKIWTNFYMKTNKIMYLKKHRDFIEKYSYGYGDRPFHYMWKLLIEQMPKTFSFLEIGVFKGQILSLVQLLSVKLGKSPKIYGVTPLSSASDKYFQHPEADYFALIKNLYKEFNLTFENTKVIKGFSHHPQIIKKVSSFRSFDLLLIDGCHDFEIVKSDIKHYKEMLTTNGIIVIDDASCHMNLPDFVMIRRGKIWKFSFPPRKINLFKGFEDVSIAARRYLDADKRFKYLFTVGHNRIWMKLRS